MMRLVVLAVAVVWVAGPPVAADELRLDAKALFGRSITRDVRLSADGSAVELEDGELFEDDGPAAGFSYLPNEEKLSDRVRARKELLIPNPAARKATLLVGPGGDLKATVNGTAGELRRGEKVGGHWSQYPIPPQVLKAGRNEIVLHGTGRVWIARAEDFAAGSTDRPRHPGRSARSTDGGESWAADQLGPKGDIAGEYCVRLFLDHVRPAGSLTLQVLDAGNLAGLPIAPPAEPGPVRVRLDAELGATGRARLWARAGSTITPDTANWSDWQDIGSAAGELTTPRGRFFQVAVVLSTTDPLASPRVKGLRIETTAPAASEWAAKLKIAEARNAEVVRTSVPFAYEPFDHPRLKELRTRYDLDAVVKGAKGEFEVITRLAAWSSKLWDRGHLKDIYPAWDALEILKSHADGNPVGGFCQQYNLVFLQACEAFGIPGRAVSISGGDGGQVRGSGHEVVELWSNQYRKWVYVDGNMAWYAADEATGVPLSLWELRRRQLPVVTGEPPESAKLVHLRDDGKRWESLAAWPGFLEMRLIPRSNFLAEKAPLPLNQGMRGWFWTGHHAWTDAALPAAPLYGLRVTDRRNWEWTLNQTRYTLEATPTPGELRVHLDTETPGFDTFLASLDGGAVESVQSGFVWKLHAGKNRLEVRVRNVAGLEGGASHVVIDRP